jgi:RimJ/RimL family protein N-acetyltransferase
MIYGQLTRLRAIARADLPVLVAWRNDPDVTALLGGWSFPVALDQEEAWLENTRKDKNNQRLAIERLDTNAYIGNIGLYDIDWKNRKAEYAILIGDKTSWGGGFGLDASHALLKFAFNELNLYRVWLRVLASHERAIKLYRKIGFIEEGVMRGDTFRDGAYRDTLVMSILQPEYMAWLTRQE